MSYVIIGTAGHVDHGKTMLIKSLTGQDTDRLREEKERGISIDLGFAPFRLPGGRLAGVVDVPGHERFINNMLAGIGGIDLVLLVVDVSEGVMPQTKEHLAILDLLKVGQGIIVITKIDLAESSDWIDLVEEEIKDEVKGTFMEKAPVARVSVVKGEGLDNLKDMIDSLTSKITEKNTKAPFRVPIDRIFSVPGFGTVVTGTIVSGEMKIGDDIEILPLGESFRLRQVQVHGEDTEKAEAGQRVALNLSGVEKKEINRGSVAAKPGYFSATSICDVRVKILSDSPWILKNRAPLHFYLGTDRVVARAVLLEGDELAPGEEGLAQLRLERPMVIHREDRFIIRSYSPVTTIGGGLVLDHRPERHKRHDMRVLEKLRILEKGDPAEYVVQFMEKEKLSLLNRVAKGTRLEPEFLKIVIERLIEEERLMKLGEYYILTDEVLQMKGNIIKWLKDYHIKHPLHPGYYRASLKNIIDKDLPSKAYEELLAVLEDEGKIQLNGEWVAENGFEPTPSIKQNKILNDIETMMREKGFSPPSKNELMEELKVNEQEVKELLNFLLYREILIKVSDEWFYHKDTYNEAIIIIKDMFSQKKELTLAEYRDALGASRKFAQALLEHFDHRKMTRRQGDVREAWKMPED